MKSQILTKSELKDQKNKLSRYNRFLPMLQLKKKHLQQEILKVKEEFYIKNQKYKSDWNDVMSWVQVFGEEQNLEKKVEVGEVEYEMQNVAGIQVPIFQNLQVNLKSYNFISTPLWVDRAVKCLEKMYSEKTELKILSEKEKILNLELQITNQRINLFEKVKIPEAQSVIRKIHITLDDQMALNVARAKETKKRKSI